MSDIIKLNIKTKKIKAFIPDQMGGVESFTELPQVLEREKQEHAHKLELENAFKKGLEQGQTDTTNKLGQHHSEDLLNQSKDFYNIISTFEEKIKSIENNFHSLVIEVSKKISEKILQHEIGLESTIENILEQNLKKIIGSNDVIIKLNPSDYELLQKSKNEHLISAGITKIRFESSKNIQLGGCLIESEVGNLDARVETQINELTRALENHFSKVEIE